MRAPMPLRSGAATALLVAACLASTSALSFAGSPDEWIVDPNGGGDFTTIQAALDAYWNGLGWRYSIVVKPGTYPETMTISNWSPWYIVAAGGPAVTAVNSVSFVNGLTSGSQIDGFTFTEDVQFSQGDGPNVIVTGCTFQASVNGSDSRTYLEDCDLYGRAVFEHFEATGSSSSIRNSRFHSAPLYVGTGDGGDISVTNCEFEGPADTLLCIVSVNQSNYVHVTNCRFENARKGLVLGLVGEGGLMASRCSFSNVYEAALWRDEPMPELGHGFQETNVWDSRFDHCGTAIRWRDVKGWPNGGQSSVHFVRDTVTSCTSDGMVLSHFGSLTLDQCVVDAGGGDGAIVLADRASGPPAGSPQWTATIINSRFTDNHGTGLIFRDSASIATASELRPTNLVHGCSFVGNRGSGLEVGSGDWSVEECVSFANGGDGLVCTALVPGGSGQLVSSTSVLNRGVGIQLSGAGASGSDSSHLLVQRNLAALNARDGFHAPSSLSGSLAFNDAWSNYLGQYVGAWGSADSNLTVDPHFCDLAAGDLGLQQGSPCGAGGIYGLIGALPESCPNLVAVEPFASTLSFAVRPSIARGSVEFVPPSTGPDGRVEVFDLSGRRLWAAALGRTTGPIEWHGQSENGHAGPGVYWVRFTRASESQSQRLVWLR